MAFGGLCMALTAVCVCKLGQRLVNRTVGVWSGLLVAVNGVLLWGGVSGMEIGFVALLITGTTLALVVEAPNKRFFVTPILGFFTSLARPEAFVFVFALTIAMAWITLRESRFKSGERARTIGHLAPLLLPLVAYGGQSLFYLLVTGSTSANGMKAKSLLYKPILYPAEFLDGTLSNFHEFLRVFTGLNGFDFVFPGALITGLLGTLYLGYRKAAWFPVSIALFGGFLLVLLAISTLRTATVHHLRYAQPFLPVLLLLASIGLYGLTCLVRSRRNRRLMTSFVFTTALLFTLVEMPAWGVRLGQQAAGIRDQQVSISAWMDGNLPKDAVVAVNDVGAPAYLGDHRIVDLIGLTTNRLTVPNAHRAGALYEALGEMPEDDRPDYFVVFPDWPVHDLEQGGLFEPEPIATFRLDSPRYSHLTPGGGSACQAARSCDVVHVHEADWSSVDTGDTPVEAAPRGDIRDHVDVADLENEEEHHYRVEPAQHGFQPYTELSTADSPSGEIVDSGRTVLGGEAMTVDHLEPGRPVEITSRIATNAEETVPGETEVSVGGEAVGTWDRETTHAGWRESTFTIPAEFVTGSTLRIEFDSPPEFLGPFPEYTSYGYWYSQ
ncbi:hypothetical protein [Actinopolyspora halophila]|uniref:hypothetical protein n=1 Tax=Actinopolyspora halophila TaxID=1850 RepID=UPI00036067BF|nr:hypothetical protein [Actinopolyspora halophila]